MLLEILIPIILLFGSLSNLLNFYIFTRPALKGLSTFRFLSYLSIVDFLYLIIGLLHILVNVYFDYDFRDYSDIVCSLHSFFTYYLSHLSSNILAGVSVFRCVTLTTLKPPKPNSSYLNIKRNSNNNIKHHSEMTQFKVNRKNSKLAPSFEFVEAKNSKSFLKRFISESGRADLIVLVIMFVIFLFDFHFLIWMRLSELEDYSLELSENHANKTIIKCYPSSRDQSAYSKFYTGTYHWIDLFLYSYIPFTIMIICTTLIIYRLFQLNKQLKHYVPNKQTEISVYKDKNDNHLTKLTDSPNEVNKEKDLLNKSNQNKLNYQRSQSLAKKRSKKNNQIYKLLLTLNIFFFVLVTPLVLSNTLGSLDYFKETNRSIFEIVYILAYLNHSLNFLFYALSCEIFRTILIELFKRFF